MAKWHITITENETGDTKLDIDTDVIVAGIDDHNGTRVVHCTHADAVSHVAAMYGVTKSIEEAQTRNPILGALMTMLAQREGVQVHTETVEEGQE